MSPRTRLVVIAVVLIAVGAGVYFWYQRPRADAIPEATIDLTTGAALRGTETNKATLDNVTAEDDGTIHLAPQPSGN